MASHLFSGSTNVKEARYVATKEQLTVTFSRGDRYRYSKVPPKVWEEFKAASSPGSFVADRLTPKYAYKAL